jgi:hypothetical protein
MMNTNACKLDAYINHSGRYNNPIIDLKWLAAFLLKHPVVQLNFHGGGSFDWEAMELDDFVRVLRSVPRPTWDISAADFESMQLEPRLIGLEAV